MNAGSSVSALFIANAPQHKHSHYFWNPSIECHHPRCVSWETYGTYQKRAFKKLNVTISQQTQAHTQML